MQIKYIAACDMNWNIGKDGGLPWAYIKEDMSYFYRTTTEGRNPGVVMGRLTWESLPVNNRPLSKRVNLVLSSGDVTFAHSTCRTPDEAFHTAEAMNVDVLWVIGGGSVYRAFASMVIDEVHIVVIPRVFRGCDTTFPHEILDMYDLESTTVVNSASTPFSIHRYKRRRYVATDPK